MLVRDVMKRDVVSAAPEISLEEAAVIMTDNHVGCIVIKKNERVVGILTDRDVLLKVAEGGTEFEVVTAGAIMTRFVIYINPDANLEKAVKMMKENKIKKLPVLENEKLVGIITTTDIALAAPGLLH
ncbi:MAG: CBS domain-containing protein [Candidatus Aenigmarchaeota archaeon]|nr:CBS domain-containing protein [Candidatus Aenigmarchaeota archaeon]